MKQTFRQWTPYILGSLLLIGLTSLLTFSRTAAGLYDESSETTYREYWVNHDPNFAGQCQLVDGEWEFINPFTGTWYTEPDGFFNCPAEMTFDLSDGLSGVTRAEIYFDLWRNYDSQSLRFYVNGLDSDLVLDGDNPFRANVGSDWSRTPWVGELPLSALQSGENTLKIWKATSRFHVHDIAIRLYYNNGNPIANDPAPTAELVNIRANGQDFDPYNETDEFGQPLSDDINIDNDLIRLTANVSGDADFVEFHAYYDGYDLDNDGEFLDWQNRSRNNWHPGGKPNPPHVNPNPQLGGTIDHIGTVAVNGAGNYSIDWDMPYVMSQTNVRFKVRVVDRIGTSLVQNVRDAAGGQSRTFDLIRTLPVVAFTVPDFEDFSLLEGGGELTEEVQIDIPIDPEDFQRVFMLGSYWRNPAISINEPVAMEGSRNYSRPFDNSDGQTDVNPSYGLGVIDSAAVQDFRFDVDDFVQGTNTIYYAHVDVGFGELIERPGPMIIFKMTQSPGADNEPPVMHGVMPVPDSVFVDSNSAITVKLTDVGAGVRQNSIVMRVNGNIVSPTIRGDRFNYTLTYAPNGGFALGQTVNVEIDACDLTGGGGNCMTTQNFSFDVEPADVPFAAVSDDYNSCELNGDVWTFEDPIGDVTISETLEGITFDVPGGQSHDMWRRDQAPRIMQDVSDDAVFEVEAKFDNSPVAEIQMQGILFEQSNGDRLRFGMQYENGGLRITGVQIVDNPSGNDSPTIILTHQVPAAVEGVVANTPAHLRIMRQGTLWTVEYLFDVNGNGWRNAGTVNNLAFSVDRVGLFAGNAGTGLPAFTTTADYFFDTDEIIDPEDATVLILPVFVQGEIGLDGGTVTKSAECGNPVELTATPDLGWQFDGWLGSPLEGTADASNPNPTVTFDFGDEVTAVFSRIPYDVDVTIDNQYSVLDETPNEAGGTVTGGNASPYYIGDSVQLTATANPGWTFAGWSGDVPAGQANSSSITLNMDSDKALTATFTQNEYTVNIGVDPNSNGTGAVNGAVSGDYIYGDEITLTATPAPGNNFFVSWTGTLLPTSANPLNFTVTGDETINALFTNNRPPTVQISTNDEISRLPNQAVEIIVTGVDDEPLTLTAANMPTGATFVDNGNKTGTFRWTPSMEQQGTYQIVFNVTDAANTVPYQVTIDVEGFAIALPVIMNQAP